MTQPLIHLKVKFAEAVWHDQPYYHPQLKKKVEKDFFDRDGIYQQSMQLILSLETRKALILVGERRAGKTSMLKLLLDKVKNVEQFVSVEVPWAAIDSVEKLMLEMLSGLYHALAIDDKELWESFKTVHAVSEFSAVLTKIAGLYPEKIFVFGIDEFDSIILEQVTDSSQRSMLIGLVSMLVETSSLPVKIILMTAREINRIEVGRTSLLASRSETLRLNPFPDKDLHGMVSNIAGIDTQISEQEIDQLSTLSGQWPYFVKSLLYHLVQLPAGEARLESAKAKSLVSISDTWVHIYQKHWDDVARTVILLLAQRNGHLSLEEIQTLGTEIKAAAQELVTRGYLIQDDNSYRFRIGLLPEWLHRWPRFEEQVQKYLRDILIRLERRKDRWAGGQGEVIEVSREELRNRGF